MARVSLHSLRASSFRRYPHLGYVGGVCAGVAVYLDWNVRLIRAIAVLSLIFGGGALVLVYGLLWYVMANGSLSVQPTYLSDEQPFPQRQSSRYEERYASRRGASPAPSSSDLKARFSHLERRLSSMEECVTSNDYELRRELRKLES